MIKDNIRRLSDTNFELTDCRDLASGGHFKVVIENSLAGVYIIEEDRFLYVNPAFARIFDYSQEEIVNAKAIKDLIAPESCAAVEKHVQNRIAGVEDKSHYTFRGLRKNGSRIDVEVLVSTALLNGRRCVIGTLLDVTDQRKAEDKVRILSRAVKQSPASIVITDINGSIEYVNPKFTQLTGYSLEEVIGRNPRILNSGEKSPDEYKTLWDVIKSGSEWRGEFRNKKKNGELFWEFASISPIRDSMGEITHFVGVKEDITERKLAEHELNQRLKFEKVVSTVSSKFVGIYDIDDSINSSLQDICTFGGATSACVYLFNDDLTSIEKTYEWSSPSVSPAAALKRLRVETLHWLLSSLRDRQVTKVHDVSELPGYAEAEKKEFEREGIKSFLIVPLRLYEQLAGFVCFNNIEEIRSWSDSDQAMLWIFSQIIGNALERRNNDVLVAEGMRQQRAILNNIPDMAWLKDSESRYVAVNESFGTVCGLKPDEVAGKTDYDLWPHKLAEKYVSDDKEVIRSGKRQVFEERISDKDRKETWIETIKTPIYDGSGKIIGTTGIARDVAGRRLAEESLKKVNDKLRKAYADLQSAQSQILQQEKMASIGQLAAGIAHEVNNPMGFIISNLGSLQKYINRLEEFIKMQTETIERLAPENPDSGAILETIRENKRSLKLDYILEDSENLIKESLDGADRVKHIVQNLKDFSRIDETEIKLADINQGLESTINIVWNELKYKITLHKDYGDLPLIRCNPGQMNQVFLNILINAAQAIDKQGDIFVKTWHDNGHVHISISDTGCGIPSDKIRRIFEPFFTTKEVGKGTGLGLSIAYDIVKKHRGSIKVKSAVDKGSVFTITLLAGDRQE